MIDIHTESLVTLSQASRSLPGNPHLSTLHRWRLRGVRGVKLETCLIGGRRFTSLEAVANFAEQISAKDNKSAKSATSLSRREVESLERQCQEEGI